MSVPYRVISLTHEAPVRIVIADWEEIVWAKVRRPVADGAPEEPPDPHMRDLVHLRVVRHVQHPILLVYAINNPRDAHQRRAGEIFLTDGDARMRGVASAIRRVTNELHLPTDIAAKLANNAIAQLPCWDFDAKDFA